MTELMLILGMAAVTFTPRYLPIALAGKAQIPPLLERAFAYVPIAVLTAIIAQTVLIRDGSVQMSLDNPHLIAAFAAFATALWKRHLFLTIAVGLVVYMICMSLL